MANYNKQRNMRKLSSWGCLIALLLGVFLLSGCGGGGSSGSNGNNSPAPETAPSPDTNTNLNPNPNSKWDVDTDTNSNSNTNNQTYTDTYDIASVFNGAWRGVSGSGKAMDANGTYGIKMYGINANIIGTRISGNSGSSYITYREYWDYDDGRSAYITRITLYGDAEEVSMSHTGTDEWRCVFSDGTVIDIIFVSEKEMIVEQTGTAKISSETYEYKVRYTMEKWR